jgi:acyl-CoA thioester hydrolase
MAEADRAWPDLAGRIVEDASGRHHVLPIRVYFEDTDFSGLVYHASYLRWCERGRSDFLRLLGVHHSALFSGSEGSEAAAFVVRRMSLEFRKPAGIDDVLEVRTRLAEFSAAALELEQTVWRGASELLRARVQVVLVARSGRLLRLTSAIREAFAGDGAA